MEKKTHCAQIIEYLETHDGITHLEAIRELGVARLAARILDLRKMGYEITGKMVKVQNRCGGKCIVKRYSLRKEGGENTEPIDQREHLLQR